MWSKLYSFLYYRVLGWKTDISVPDYEKCVICAAPHTSNWDFFLGKLFYGAIRRKAHFLIKKEWFIFPFGWIVKAAGGIPVDRDHKHSMVDRMACRFARSGRFHLVVTPEGTRKPNPDWKKGFYFIALKARVPVVLVGVDYRTKTIAVGKVMYPTGDWEREIHEVKCYFKDFQGKHPRNFNLGAL